MKILILLFTISLLANIITIPTFIYVVKNFSRKESIYERLAGRKKIELL
jgi:hypothetical protein